MKVSTHVEEVCIPLCTGVRFPPVPPRNSLDIRVSLYAYRLVRHNELSRAITLYFKAIFDVLTNYYIYDRLTSNNKTRNNEEGNIYL